MSNAPDIANLFGLVKVVPPEFEGFGKEVGESECLEKVFVRARNECRWDLSQFVVKISQINIDLVTFVLGDAT